MITKMKKLSFLIHSKEYDAFLEHLRSLGVVHVIEKQAGTLQDAGLQENVALLGRCKNALRVLEPLAGTTMKESGTEFTSVEDVLSLFDDIEANKARLEQRLQSLYRDEAQLLPWGDFEPSEVERLSEAGYKMLFYTCPLRAYKEEWADRYGAVEIVRDKQKVNFVTITHADVNPDIDAEQVQLPSISYSEVVCDISLAKLDIEENDSGMLQLASEGVPLLRSKVRELDELIDFSRVKLTADKVVSDRLLLLEGWIPADKVEEARKELDMKGVFFDVEDPTPEDDIPIKLKNNRFAKLFEPLTRLYMLPSYEELDLTLFFAPFFMLFFGLCLGDTGYGLLMIVALPIFTKLFQLINPSFSKWLVVLFGASTMLCGLLSGTFFGFNIYDLNIGFVKKMKEFLYVDNSTMFTVSLAIGVVQILFGMAIKTVNLTIQLGFKYAVSTLGWLVLLLTVGVAVLAGIPFNNPVIIVLLVASAVCIYLFNSPGKNPLLNIGLGLWDTYNMATGLLGDVLSYVRLFALGLSGGILANVFNSMAIGMKPDNPVIGFIVMVLIFVIGHALNIFMNILGAIVHPMRLTFVEFFKNAGYAGGGTEYRPFRSVSN